MKLVTFGVPTPVGQVQRMGAIHHNKIIDLNMGYTRYLVDRHGNGGAYEIGTAILPPDMIAFLKRGEEGKDRARLAVDYVAKYEARVDLLGPRGRR